MRKGADQHDRQVSRSKQTVARVVTGGKREIEPLENAINRKKFHPQPRHFGRHQGAERNAKRTRKFVENQRIERTDRPQPSRLTANKYL